jgi:hypothetical protein
VRWPHFNLWLIAVIGLAAALVGLGSWVLVDRYAGGGGATEDATTLIDDFWAAVNTHDMEAAAAMLAPDAVYWDGDAIVGRNNIRLAMEGTPADYRVERIAPVIVADDEVGGVFATTYVKESYILGPAPNVFQLKDGKILRIWEFEVGATPPFDIAVWR